MSHHPALPPPVSRPWILCAVTVWVVMGTVGRPTLPPVTPGPFEGSIRLVADVSEGRFGPWALAAVEDTVVLVELESRAGRGDVVTVRGSLSDKPGSIGSRPYAGVLHVADVEEVTPSSFPLHVVGRAMRDRVLGVLDPLDDGRALLAGFLIGDTSGISEHDIEAMRRSGLAHLVAVSGSNVVLFLGVVAVVAGPLATGPRRRAAIGLVALPFYAAATRFEPSVVRASVMAGMALTGRLIGVVLEAWQLLSLAVVSILLLDPAMAASPGFQLSVAATAGVLVGGRWPVRTRWARAVAVSIGAQTAVAPLLVLGFGSVPLLSPVVNLVAAPLAAAATILGTIAVLGPSFLAGPAGWLAWLVLFLARGSAGWPQIGIWPCLGLMTLGVVSWLAPTMRRPLIVIGLIAVGVLVARPGAGLSAGSVAVLDVGQGDAILISGGDGRYALVDGGPDPGVVLDRLRGYGVTELELVVLTHAHADHAAGLLGVIEQMAVAEVWAETGPHETPASRELFAAVAARGIPVMSPQPGQIRTLGTLLLRVDGPVRRYKSANDQSIVITVDGAGRSMLLSGDIESVAQDDLAGLRTDVLKVPHHGATTSDSGWLESVGASVAVISVGENDFGHPAPTVITTLETAGAVVRRTDLEGDIVIDLTTPGSAGSQGRHRVPTVSASTRHIRTSRGRHGLSGQHGAIRPPDLQQDGPKRSPATPDLSGSVAQLRR